MTDCSAPLETNEIHKLLQQSQLNLPSDIRYCVRPSVKYEILQRLTLNQKSDHGDSGSFEVILRFYVLLIHSTVIWSSSNLLLFKML